MSTNKGGKRAGAGRKKKFIERVNVSFPVERVDRDKLRDIPNINDFFDLWVERILESQLN